MRWRAAPSRLLVAARLTAARTAGGNGAKRRAALSPQPLKAAQATARRMEAGGGASTRAASRRYLYLLSLLPQLPPPPPPAPLRNEKENPRQV